MNLLYTRAMQVLEKGLDAAALKHRAISHNLANLNTPGYKSLQVDFTERFRKALVAQNGPGVSTTAPGHMAPPRSWGSVQPMVTRDTSTSMRSDGNNVDIDAEMVGLAENQIYYQALAQQISARLSLMSTVISEGGR